MKRLIPICFLLLSAATYASGQSPFSAETDSLILLGIDQTFACDYNSALVTFREVTARHPGHEVGYFYLAATYQSMMMDFSSGRWDDDFYPLVDKALTIGLEKMESDSSNSWTLFYIGSAYSFKGLYQGQRGHLLPGYFSSSKGMRYLKKAKEADSTLYDIYLGLGGYHYWSSRYLRWFPLVRDKREEGREQVRLSMEKGNFSYWVGLHNLGWIEYNMENYDTALDCFQKGLERYPTSRFFMWGVADCYFKSDRYREAADIYEALLASILSVTAGAGYNEGECRKKLFLSYFELEEYEKGYAHCKALLEKPVDDETAKYLRSHYKLAEEYRMRCLEKLGRVTRM